MAWALARGNTGFSVYLSGKTKDDGSMEWEGIAHTFAKDNNVWKTKGKLEMEESGKKMSKEELKTKFPKKGKGFQDDPENLSGNQMNDGEAFWFFLEDSGEMKALDDTYSNPFKRPFSWNHSVYGGKTPVDMKE